jgi:putative phosphoribosyl transferase
MDLPLGDNQRFAFDQNIEVEIPAGGVILKGQLYLPSQSHILVISANNNEGSRALVCNRYVAEVLRANHIGTLLVDLLTPDEEECDEIQRELHFDALMLAGRLDRVAEWVRAQPVLHNVRLGYLCSSTCGGAALIAAAQHPGYVMTLVCQGARPDLAGPFLSKVTAPTLLLVGENDDIVIELNRRALTKLNKQSRLSIIPGATHLFEEPGALEEMTRQAVDWFITQASISHKNQNTSSSA